MSNHSSNRLKTSMEVSQILDSLMSVLRLSSKAAIMRIGIALSLRSNSSPLEEFKHYDSRGFEINKGILFGNHEKEYEALILNHYSKVSSDDSDFNELYFPKLVYCHIERGVRMLNSEYKYAGNYDKVIYNLINMPLKGE